MQRPGLQSQCTLQSFEQRNVFRDIVVLTADPLSDSDFAVVGTVDNHPNTGRPWISQGAAVHVGHQIWHQGSSLSTTCAHRLSVVKIIILIPSQASFNGYRAV